MKTTKTKTVIVLAILALGVAGLLAGSIGQGKNAPQRGLVQRVEDLEGQVADLTARVEALEGGSCMCSCDVLHLNPLADFPSDPSEGDVCVARCAICGQYHFYFYISGSWLPLKLGGPPF